jgi:hypothetical protein
VLLLPSIAMESSGRIGIFNNPGTGYKNFIAKDVISSGGIFSVDLKHI